MEEQNSSKKNIFSRGFKRVKSSPILAFAILTGSLAIGVPAVNMIVGDQIGSSASTCSGYKVFNHYRDKGFFGDKDCNSGVSISKSKFIKTLDNVSEGSVNLKAESNNNTLKYGEFAIMVLRYSNPNWFNEYKTRPDYYESNLTLKDAYYESNLARTLLRENGVTPGGSKWGNSDRLNYNSVSSMFHTIEKSNSQLFSRLSQDLRNNGKEVSSSNELNSEEKSTKIENPTNKIPENKTCKDLDGSFAPYADAMQYFNKKQWIVGDGNGNCWPGKDLSRDNLAIILFRIENGSFDGSYKQEIQAAHKWASKNGLSGDIKQGSDPITRVEFARAASTFMDKFGYKSTKESRQNKGNFSDTDDQSANRLFKEGIMIGVDGNCNFAPNNHLVRGQFALTMYRMIHKGYRRPNYVCNYEEQQISTKWVDENNELINGPTKGEHPAQEIEGYDFVETDKKSEEGFIIHRYKKIKQEYLTRYVDQNDKDIVTPEAGEKPKKDIPDYEYLKTLDPYTTKNDGVENTVLKHVYIKKDQNPKELKYITKWLDQDNKPLKDEEKGQQPSHQADFPEYIYEGSTLKNEEDSGTIYIVHKFKKIVNDYVTKWLDQNDKPIKKEEKGNKPKSEISGYIFVKTEPEIVTNNGNVKNIVKIHRYKKEVIVYKPGVVIKDEVNIPTEPQRLAETGPVETFSAIMAIGSVTAAIWYYVSSKRRLM